MFNWIYKIMIKTKIGIGILVLAAFIAGGFMFSALYSNAFWGPPGGEEISEEMKAKIEEFKAMTPEERQEQREECIESGECPRFRMRMGHGFGLFKFFGEDVNHEVITLDNGVQITITSDNPDVVEKLHNLTEKINNLEE